MPTYRALFPDHIGMVTKKGDKFNFAGGLLTTDDPDIIEILDERITRNKDVTRISQEEADKISDGNRKTAEKASLEERINANPEGETTISPSELLKRIQMTQAAAQAEKAASQELSVAGQLRPQTGIVSSATLEAHAPSNGKPVSNVGIAKK